jgi:hypothetical protein
MSTNAFSSDKSIGIQIFRGSSSPAAYRSINDVESIRSLLSNPVSVQKCFVFVIPFAVYRYSIQ